MFRNGFVSNSSSCSFIVDFEKPINKFSDFVSALEDNLTEALNEVKIHDDSFEDMDEADFIMFLYRIYKKGEEYKKDEIDYSASNDREFDAMNKIKDPDEVLNEPLNKLGYFEFSSESYDPENMDTFLSSDIEGYGIGHDIFKHLKYLWINMH